MLKNVSITRNHNNNHNKRGKKANKNIRKKQTKKNLQLHSGGGGGSSGNANSNISDNSCGNKEKFQVTTFRSITKDDLDRFKISNYVNSNIDWGIMPGPPPTDCAIL
jgi:hypothetical protein